MTEHELDILLRDYGGAVRSVCRAILPGHPQDAEEAEADTFYKLWRGAHLPADETHRRRLVVRTARQCAIDRYRALLRGQYTLRILYDVDNARGMEGDDLVWDTANFTLYKPKGASERKWDYGASNVDVGPISGYAVGPWDGRYEASENDTLSCFVDIPLLYEKGNNRTLYIGDLTNYSAKASVKITLPDAPPTLTVDVKKTIALKGGHWFHYDMTDEEAEQYPDATFDIQEVRIEPLAVSVIGKNHGSLPLGDTSRYDVQSRVKLFRADGTELTYGWDGEFYKGSYGRENKNSGQMTLRVDSYDILDPEAVAWVEIDGERFEVE